MKGRVQAALAGLLLAGAGCATTEPPPLRTGDIFLDASAALERGPARDRVLWQYRLALAELRRGRFDAAQPVLDDALLTLGGAFGPNADARKSRRLFQAEAGKTFIGEPYERAMAYFYRGILYWRTGELDNARACFRSAQFEDSDSEQGQYRNDYVLFDYLDGLATAKLGGDGRDAWERAVQSARGAKPPPYDLAVNTLVFLDFGPGPLKYAGGEHGEQLRFRTAVSPVQAVQLRVSGQMVTVQPADDLNFQATTRGGRVMDHVLAGQAVFKSTADSLGDAAILTGAVLANTSPRKSNQNEIGAGLMIAGVLSKIAAAAARPEADTRTWEALPQFLALGQFRLPPGEHTLTVDFLDAGGRAKPSLQKQITFTVPARRDAVIYVSDQSSTPQTQ